jgi:hypothetical protein
MIIQTALFARWLGSIAFQHEAVLEELIAMAYKQAGT